MAQQTQRSALIQRDITFFLLVGVFLPLTILLFMVPGSWYRAEGYEDLGLLTFVAKDEVTRNKKHYIIYQTNAEGGFRFLEKVPMLYTAKEAVENHQTVQRHVYRAWTRPNPILGLIYNAGTFFLERGEDLQSQLNLFRNLSLLVRGVGLCYIGGYAFLFYRHRVKKTRPPAGKAGQN